MKSVFLVVCLAMLSMVAACTPKKVVPLQIPEAGKIEKIEKEEGDKKKAEKDVAEKPKRRAERKKRVVKYVPPVIKHMKLIGQKEYIYLNEVGLKLPARIDTGATTSSIHAVDVQRYERDGKRWVRFTIIDPATGKGIKMERPLSRKVRIKQHDGEGDRRYSVKLWVTLGGIKCRTEFTLADRSDFKMPALIGRSLIHGRAVVDVTREYTSSPLNDAYE